MFCMFVLKKYFYSVDLAKKNPLAATNVIVINSYA